MPVNFHIGASDTSMSWFGTSPWPGLDEDRKIAIGSAMMYLSNARIIANLMFSGVLERFPTVKFVSVESGIGWMPFFLESLDYQLYETAPSAVAELVDAAVGVLQAAGVRVLLVRGAPARSR